MEKLIWDDRVPQILALEMTRGDDVKFTFAHPYGPGSAIAQIRMQVLNSSGVVRINVALDTDPGQFDTDTDGFCTIELYNSNTEGIVLTEEPFHYAVEMYDLEDLRLTSWSGTFTFIDDYITDGISSPSETWETREDLTAAIAAQLLYVDNVASQLSMSRITSAVTTGDSIINVADGTIVAAADEIRVQGTAAYTVYTVDNQDATSITITTTVGEDSAVGDMVAKVI